MVSLLLPIQWAQHGGPSQEAERRCCYGGDEAGRRASLGELGRMVGQGPLGSFWDGPTLSCLPKGTRRKGETRRKN